MANKSLLMQSIDDFRNGRYSSDAHIIGPAPDYKPDDVKAIRKKAGMTQRVLADRLMVSPRTVQAWEIGRSHPQGSSRRLLSMLDKSPEVVNELIKK